MKLFFVFLGSLIVSVFVFSKVLAKNGESVQANTTPHAAESVLTKLDKFGSVQENIQSGIDYLISNE